MNKFCVFIIEGNELFFYKKLLDFNGFPMFYLCNDSLGNFYIILCYEYEKLLYIVSRMSKKSIWEMLHGKISLEEFMGQGKEYWRVAADSSNNKKNDIVERESFSSLTEKGIFPFFNSPYGEYFELVSEDLKEIAENFSI